MALSPVGTTATSNTKPMAWWYFYPWESSACLISGDSSEHHAAWRPTVAMASIARRARRRLAARRRRCASAGAARRVWLFSYATKVSMKCTNLPPLLKVAVRGTHQGDSQNICESTLLSTGRNSDDMTIRQHQMLAKLASYGTSFDI
jgi:hypothetical protein